MPALGNKSQIGIHVPKELKAELERIARNQDRSLSNMLTVILKDYVNKQKNEEISDNAENMPGDWK